MILASTLLVGVVGLGPTAPPLLEPVEPFVPGTACVAPVVPVLYLGGPLHPCPAPRERSQPSFVPALPHSAIDE